MAGATRSKRRALKKKLTAGVMRKRISNAYPARTHSEIKACRIFKKKKIENCKIF